jgi:hypothetical protein
MKRAWLIFLAYVAITVALTYPLVLHFGSVLPHDPGDPALNTWILWWNTQRVPFTSAWWNAPAFYPVPGVLAFSENLLGLSLIATPLHWLGVGPQGAYNAVFFLTFPLSAIGAYLLVFELTNRRDAAFLAGLMFGFAPYRIAHLPQIQALASFPVPFALLGLHRYLRDPRPRWLALFAGGWLLQGLCNGYYLMFFSVFAGLWVVWFASPWARPRQFLAIAIAWGIAALPMVPLLVHYRQVHAMFGFVRDFGTIRGFSADVAGLLHVSDHVVLWRWLDVFRRGEGELFPGLTVALLVLAGLLLVRERKAARIDNWMIARRVLITLTAITAAVSLWAFAVGSWRLHLFGVRLLSVSNPIKPLTVSLLLALGLALTSPALRQSYRSRSILGFYGLAGFLMWLCTLGPAPTVMGKELMYRGPYSVLMMLPGFNALRVPARFWMMTTMCLAVVGAIVFDRLVSRAGSRRSIVCALLCLGVLADTWVSPMPLSELPPAFKAVDCVSDPNAPIVELPVGHIYRDVAGMYRQMAHGHPLVNGYSGYFPPHYAALRFGLETHDPDMLSQLASHGVKDVIVDREVDRGAWETYVRSYPGAKEVCTEGQQSLYHIEAQEASAAVATAGSPLALSLTRVSINEADITAMFDNDRTTRWQSGPQRQGTTVEVDFGAVRTVSGIDLQLGPFAEDFPRGLIIEASADSISWTEIWRGRSAGLAFVGAFESPLEVALKYRFAPVQARALRMRLTENDDTYYWSIAEMRVLGP